ncbi:hypothetical protein G6F22_018777 [Rhizopus arrhizus]|nr:hypothetical protein G6F22_018777 [Rhizopus arrhizus]
MLYNYKTMYGQAIHPGGKEYVGGFGKFRHYSQPYTPENREIVTPNNDTPYSWAWLDLRTEPWVLSLPATPKDRYNVFQMVDLYTYNFAYAGVRATGFGAGNYLIAGPRWDGGKPKGITKPERPVRCEECAGLAGQVSIAAAKRILAASAARRRPC